MINLCVHQWTYTRPPCTRCVYISIPYVYAAYTLVYYGMRINQYRTMLAIISSLCDHQAQKLAVVVELLLGDIPDRGLFRQATLRKTLVPYLQLTQGTQHFVIIFIFYFFKVK